MTVTATSRATVRTSSGAVLSVFFGAGQMPVSLGAVSVRCLYCPLERLLRELASSYASSALARSPLLLGSLDLLGNPTFLLQGVGAGVRDLLLLPKNALGQGPRAFIGAVGGGLMSLLRHTTEGTLTSVSGFSSSVARNMERLAGATDQEMNSNAGSASASSRASASMLSSASRERPRSLGVGLFSGVRSLGAGVVGGLVSVVSRPLAGASSGEKATSTIIILSWPQPLRFVLALCRSRWSAWLSLRTSGAQAGTTTSGSIRARG